MRHLLNKIITLVLVLAGAPVYASDAAVAAKSQADINFNQILLNSGNEQKTLHNDFNRMAGNSEASQDQLDDGASMPDEAMVALISK